MLVQRRVDGDVAHFTLTTFWDSIAGESAVISRS